MVSCKMQKPGHNKMPNPIASPLCLAITVDFSASFATYY